MPRYRLILVCFLIMAFKPTGAIIVGGIPRDRMNVVIFIAARCFAHIVDQDRGTLHPEHVAAVWSATGPHHAKYNFS